LAILMKFFSESMAESILKSIGKELA